MAMKPAEAQRMNFHYMADAMRMLEWDLHQTIQTHLRIPDEWHLIAQSKGARRKTRVTLRLDEDLVRFFRSMGPDWQVRVNRLMSVWMHARLAGLIHGSETMNYLKRSPEDDEGFDRRRPHWGDNPDLLLRSALAEICGEAFGKEVEFDEEGIPLRGEGKSSAVLKAEYLVMKAKRGE